MSYISVVLLVSFTVVPCTVQSQTPAVFDAASVRPSRIRIADGQKGAGAAAAPVVEADHLTFRARGLSLYGLIVEAYGLKYCRPFAGTCAMLSGGPAWITKDVFDIDAKSPSGSKEYTTTQLSNGNAPQLEEELRKLLSDRFQLRAHFEVRQLSVYSFTIADGGIRINPTTTTGSSSVFFKEVNPPAGLQAMQVVGVRSTIQELANLYARFMDRPVIDTTGLTGRFDFTVQYEVDPDATGPFAAATAPTLFGAFEKQAGLKLKATRGPVNVLVIDKSTRPGAN